jgi:hypothetical protein
MCGRNLCEYPGFDPMLTLRSGRRASLLALMVLAACTSSRSQDLTGGMALTQPALVVIQDFAVSPQEVQLDAGLLARHEETRMAANGVPRTAQELAIGHEVANALADKLVAQVADLGLVAQRGREVPPNSGVGLLISGQLVSIDQGNRTERVAIGLGAGRSDVRVRAQVYEVTRPGDRRLIQEIEVDAKSGLKPGMAETMGAGALGGHLLVATAAGAGLSVVSETMSDTVVADADRAAAGIGKQLARLFGQQGWLGGMGPP